MMMMWSWIDMHACLLAECVCLLLHDQSAFGNYLVELWEVTAIYIYIYPNCMQTAGGRGNRESYIYILCNKYTNKTHCNPEFYVLVGISWKHSSVHSRVLLFCYFIYIYIYFIKWERVSLWVRTYAAYIDICRSLDKFSSLPADKMSWIKYPVSC